MSAALLIFKNLPAILLRTVGINRLFPQPQRSLVATPSQRRSKSNIVFTERTDHVTLHAADKKVGSRVCAVFEMSDVGLIAGWREYWDSGDVIRQMGISAEALAAAM
jgi:Limonene-1,2-epoxide hydrolase catalytic domain